MINKLKKIINQKKTLLGVGPMSLNSINAAINIANKKSILLILIASRRQIDSKVFGAGYVNNWTTNDYSKYVKKNDKKNNIILARDHGGPWQNNLEIEQKLTLKQAMISAKKSLKEDIDSGFKILHLDTCLGLNKAPTSSQALSRLFELYEFCCEYAKKSNKKLIFEIGTEEQNGTTNSPHELEETLNKVYKFCDINKYPRPSFVVIQSGTRVLETRNVGSFESPLRIQNELPVEIQLPKMIDICKKYKIFMKEHNGDYLSDDSLKWHPKLGIHSVNVAPEFGVTESRSIVKLFNEFKLNKLLDEFLEISYSSNKWKKWMMPDSKASDFEKSIISGHYIFSNKKFLNLKDKAKTFLIKKNINLDKFLQNDIEKSILRYVKFFKLIK